MEKDRPREIIRYVGQQVQKSTPEQFGELTQAMDIISKQSKVDPDTMPSVPHDPRLRKIYDEFYGIIDAPQPKERFNLFKILSSLRDALVRQTNHLQRRRLGKELEIWSKTPKVDRDTPLPIPTSPEAKRLHDRFYGIIDGEATEVT